VTTPPPTTPPPDGLLAAGASRAASVPPPAAVPPPSAADPSPSAEGRALLALRRRRDELAEQVVELHWDLGGLAYEMAVRDHFRLDVLVRRAAALQERDAELAEVERLLRLEESASAGACPACGAPHSRGALFCWQCGGTLMERVPSSAVLAESGGVESAGAHSSEAPSSEAPDTAAQDTLVMDPAPAFGE
jgi:hypothetical protein